MKGFVWIQNDICAQLDNYIFDLFFKPRRNNFEIYSL